MIKVVLDTNIFVSSFFGGNPRKIISLWEFGEIMLCLSRPIVDEYVEVLRRMGLQDEKELGELLGLFAAGANVVFTAKTPELQVVADDPDDDKFIECAVASKCKTIISGDKHLLKLTGYNGIDILKPRQFVDSYL